MKQKKGERKSLVGWIDKEWFLHSCPMCGSLDNVDIIEHSIIHKLKKTHYLIGHGKPIKVRITIEEL